MGSAFQCDVCGDFEAGTPLLTVIIRTRDATPKDTNHELCTSCLAEQMDWLNQNSDEAGQA